MQRKTMMLALAGLCMTALVACSGAEPDPNATKSLKMTRLANGDLQYCDENGVCQTLPYGGACASLEITVDLQTGETCQACVLADGTEIDQGCSNTAVACVLVTVPEPDCVVCAYVNGAIVFSDCVANGPVCVSDADCYSERGAGRCVNSECIVDPGCTFDEECPEGFVCEATICPALDCLGAEDCPSCSGGTCVPETIECTSNEECPDGMICTVYCLHYCAPSSDGQEYCDGCTGVCEPNSFPCASNFDCPTGHFCDFSMGAGGGSGDRAEAPALWMEGSCMPLPSECWADSDCPSGFTCVMPLCDAAEGADEPTCWGGGGYCEATTTNGCQVDEECPDGMMCQITECDRCAEGERCGGACFGTCVPVATECLSNDDCPDGLICALLDCGGSEEGFMPDCVGGAGVCVRVEPPFCTTNEECVASGAGNVCMDGECAWSHDVFDCDPSHALCDMVPPTCPDGLVPSIMNGCYGPCVDPSLCLATECVVSGCSGQTCADVPVETTCEYEPAYACFAAATCERQADGVCGWTATDELALCLERAQR